MKNVLEEIKNKAKALQKKIVLCEGEDSRVVKAAAMATEEGIEKSFCLATKLRLKRLIPTWI